MVADVGPWHFADLISKVGDVFTVPLCAIHHNDDHRVGKEEIWWHERNLDPLTIARDLWEQSQGAPVVGETLNGSESSLPREIG